MEPGNGTWEWNLGMEPGRMWSEGCSSLLTENTDNGYQVVELLHSEY